MNNFAFATLVVIAAVLSTACNTIQGVGRDIERSGQAIEKAATK